MDDSSAKYKQQKKKSWLMVSYYKKWKTNRPTIITIIVIINFSPIQSLQISILKRTYHAIFLPQNS